MGASCGKVSPEDRDRDALVKLFQRCGGAVPMPGWKRQRFWCGDKEVFLWDGVTCDKQTGRVVKLVLRDNNLYGQVPSAISLLTELQEIDLSDNRLSGVIPASLLDLPHLAVVRFTGNPQLQSESVQRFKQDMRVARPGVKVFVDDPPPSEEEEKRRKAKEEQDAAAAEVA